MLILIAAVYLLLAIRIRITAELWFASDKGGLTIAAQAGGICFRFDGVILRRGIMQYSLVPRYGRQKKRAKENSSAFTTSRRLLWFVRRGKKEQITLKAHVGLNDAAETAAAAGCLHAAAAALISCIGGAAVYQAHIMPDFSEAGWAMCMRCVCSCQAGDLVTAACRDAVRRKTRQKRKHEKTTGRTDGSYV